VAPPAPYEPTFYEAIEREALASAEIIVPLVRRLFVSDSVLDVGCGHGTWLSVFKRAGSRRVRGLDGRWVDQTRLAISEEEFQATDLNGEWSVPDGFDVAVCLEVAEHLPSGASGHLVENLVRAAPVILFSAALPGQGGTNHVNEQWPEYWDGLFGKHGFERLDPFRRQVWQDPRVAWYYQQNLYAYVSRRMLEGASQLREERERMRQCPVTLVHDKMLRPVRQLRPAVRLLPALLLAALRRRWTR